MSVWSKERFTDGEDTNREDGDLLAPQIHLKKEQGAVFFYVKGRGKQEWQEVIDDPKGHLF